MVAAAIDPGAFGFVAPIGKPLLFVLETLARYTLGPIIGGIAWLLDAILPTPHAPPQPPMPSSPLTNRNEQQDTPGWLQITGYVLAGGLVAVLALALLGALWLLFRRYAKPRERPHERRTDVEREPAMASGLGSLLGGLLRRPQRARPSRSSLAVRRLYHEVLERAARDGIERPAAATPLQFAPHLDAHFGSDAPSAISDAFAASRYGQVAFDEDVVRALRERWRRAAGVG
jgi:hypothetical protein